MTTRHQLCGQHCSYFGRIGVSPHMLCCFAYLPHLTSLVLSHICGRPLLPRLQNHVGMVSSRSCDRCLTPLVADRERRMFCAGCNLWAVPAAQLSREAVPPHQATEEGAAPSQPPRGEDAPETQMPREGGPTLTGGSPRTSSQQRYAFRTPRPLQAPSLDLATEATAGFRPFPLENNRSKSFVALSCRFLLVWYRHKWTVA